MSQCGLQLYFSTRSPPLLPFQIIASKPILATFSATQLRFSMSDQIPILSIGLDFLEELPDDCSARKWLVSGCGVVKWAAFKAQKLFGPGV
jgi:hypothetical protein